MSEQERLLITKIRRRPDGKGADLFSRGHRYPTTTLFELSDLALVGLDYDALPVGVETPCRFVAVVQPGKEKPNSETGAHYLDVLTLEPTEQDSAAMATDMPAMLQELRRIAALLEVLVTAAGMQIPDLPEVATDAGGDGDGDQEPGDGSPTPESNGRPLPAARIREVVRLKAGWKGPLRLDSEPITEKQILALASLLSKAIRQKGLTQALMDKARHQVLGYLVGVDSTRRLTKWEASALIDWLAGGNGNAAELNEHARAEVAAVLAEIAREQGQLEMPL
jgi:hypothetical protein